MKRIITIFLTLSVAFVAMATQKAPKVVINKISEEFFNFPYHVKPSNVGKDGVLRYTPKGNGWEMVITSKEGVLKNGSQYQLDLDVNVLGDFSQDKCFEICVRNIHGYVQWGDIARTTRYKSASGDFQKISVRFEVPRDGRKYQIVTHAKQAPVEVKNLVLRECFDLKEIPITTDAKPSNVDLGKLPTGAKEFEVDMPRPAKTLVVNAHDFGLSESSTENHIAIRKAIEHCKKVGASKLTMKKGVYKCFGEDAGAFKFVGFKDFTFDGNGSTFIFRRVKPVESFWIDGCQRIRFYNFDIDWDWETDPLASIVQIIGAGEENGKRYFDLAFTEFENDTHPRYNKYIRFASMSPYDPVKKAVGIENGQEDGWGFLEHFKGPETKWLDKNKIRVYSHLWSKQIGKYYRAQHWYYHSDAFKFIRTNHITFDRVNIRSTRGASFYGLEDCSNVQIRNCKIAPKKLYRRPQTCTADHFYITNPKGNIKVENCEFSRGGDDCINFHGPITYTQKVNDYTLRLVTTKGHWLFKKDETVEVFDAKYNPFNLKMKIKEYKWNGPHCELTFYDKLPEQRNGGFVLLIPRYSKGNVIIRNSKFHSNRARGLLLLMGDVTVENCHIYDVEMVGMRLETGYAICWAEGTFTNNVVVRNCTFEANNSTGTQQLDGYESDIIMGAYMISYPSGDHAEGYVVNDALFENNTFINSWGLVARIISSNNVIFKGNTIKNSIPRKLERDYRGCFYVKNSKDIKIIDNVWHASPTMKNPRVIIDSANSKNIVVEGNKLVK